MVVARRDVWWAELGELRASEPGLRRPIVVVQADAFNRSRLRTVIAVALTSDTRYLDGPGNVLLPGSATGLPRDSVANVTQIVSVDEDYLDERVGRIPRRLMRGVDLGFGLVPDLGTGIAPGRPGQK